MKQTIFNKKESMLEWYNSSLLPGKESPAGERLQHKSTFPFFLFPRQTYARLKLDLERDKGSAAVHIC